MKIPFIGIIGTIVAIALISVSTPIALIVLGIAWSAELAALAID